MEEDSFPLILEIKCKCKTPHVVKAGTKTDTKGVRQLYQCTGKTGCGKIILGEYLVLFEAQKETAAVQPKTKV
jgi:hypothetical protein